MTARQHLFVILLSLLGGGACSGLIYLRHGAEPFGCSVKYQGKELLP